MPGETPWQAFDDLSAPARAVLQADPHAYTRLVVHGGANPTSREALNRLSPGSVLANPTSNPTEVRPLVAGLWLWIDGLDESHTISQALPSATGSFWHAIMHRREGDFSNAKYWYARCRHHPVLHDLPVHVEANLGGPSGLKGSERLARGGWEPDALVDLVRDVHARPDDPRHATAVRLQQVEWQELFDHCLRAAAGEEMKGQGSSLPHHAGP